jgi:hypothetical protein
MAVIQRKLLTHFIIITIIMVSVLALVNLNIGWNNRDQIDTTLSTLRKIDNFPVYEMSYKGDYRFEEYLKQGGSWPSIEQKIACTCFAALSGYPLFGRNFDFPKNPVLVLHTSPPGHFASISLVDLSYFDFDMQHPPDSGDLSKLLKTPYLPFDGMNEKGVFIGMMAVPAAAGPQDTGKINIGEIEVIRLILDYASNLDEALDLIESYNIIFTNLPIHYLIADKSGQSAVIEFLRGEMNVIRNSEPWQVSTNFIITDSEAPFQIPCSRYRIVYEELKEKEGKITFIDAMNLLQKSSQKNTVWSAVYDPQTLEMSLALGGNYNNIIKFKIQK